MWWALFGLIVALSLLSLVVSLARANGQNAERIRRLKQEAEENANAQNTIDNVRNTTIDRVREKLQQTK